MAKHAASGGGGSMSASATRSLIICNSFAQPCAGRRGGSCHPDPREADRGKTAVSIKPLSGIPGESADRAGPLIAQAFDRAGF
jgi:hypothetical protein